MNRTSSATYKDSDYVLGKKQTAGAHYMFSNGESRVFVFFDFKKQWCSYQQEHRTKKPDWVAIAEWLRDVEKCTHRDHGINSLDEGLDKRFVPLMKKSFKPVT